MSNNVATAGEIVRNIGYRVLLWVGAWARSSGRVFLIPVVIIIVLILLDNGVLVGSTDVLATIPGSEFVVTISADLVRLVLFSTALLLSVKLSVLLKREIYTVRNITTPRYMEYAGERIEYNTSSIFTTGYLPDSTASDVELETMKSYGDMFSIASYGLFFIINIVVFLIDESVLIAAIESILVQGTTSDLIFAMIGYPILLANLINSLDPSVYPTPETALFFIQVGIPSLPLVLGYRNSISYWKYTRANSILTHDEYTVFLGDICSFFFYCSYSLLIPYQIVFFDMFAALISPIVDLPRSNIDYPVPPIVALLLVIIFGLILLKIPDVVDFITDERVDCEAPHKKWE